MPAPLMHAMRVAKSSGATSPAGKHAEAGSVEADEARYDRHHEGALMQEAEAIAEQAGNGLFNKSFLLGALGWVGAHTIGRFYPKAIPQIGKYTFAPVHALDTISLKDLSMNTLKANYFTKVGEYVEKHGATRGLNAAEWYAKAEALGGAKIAQAEWKGFQNLLPYLKNRSLFGTVMAGGLLASGLLAFIRTGTHARNGLDDLIAVAEDLDGQHYSRLDMIQHPEKLSPAMQEVRANLKAHLIPDAVGAVGRNIEHAAFAAMGGPAAHSAVGFLGDMGTMGAMMGGTMLEQSAESLKPSLDFAGSYLHIKDMLADGKQPAPETYAKLLASASAEVRRMGGANAELVQRLAETYAQEKISAKDLVKEVFAKAPFEARVKSIAETLAKEAEAEVPKASEALEAPAMRTPEMPAQAALSHAVHDGKMLQQQRHVGA